MRTIIALILLSGLVLLTIHCTSGLTDVEMATSFCAGQIVGRYVYNGDDTKYYLCYMYGGNMLGNIYTCPGTTTFDDTVGLCAAP